MVPLSILPTPCDTPNYGKHGIINKTKIHNVLYQTTTSHSHSGPAQKILQSLDTLFLRYVSRQRGRHTDRLITILHTRPGGEVMKCRHKQVRHLQIVVQQLNWFQTAGPVS